MRRPLWALVCVLLASSLAWSTASVAAPAPVTILQNAAVATGNGVSLSVADKGLVGVNVTGTFVGTITWEGSTDGITTWSSISCTTIDTLTASSAFTTTGQLTCSTAGLTAFRARISAYTSGTITVTGFPTGTGGGSGAGGSSAGTSVASCWATAAAPTYSEGLSNFISCTLGGLLRVSVEAFNILIEGEDQLNHLLMTSGGAVRVFPIMTNVTTNTTSATTIVHSGGKTPMASLTGTGALTGTVTFYGDMENSTTNGEWICTLVLDATTKKDGYCNQFTKDYTYYHAATTLLTGTGATVQAQINAGAIGIKTNEFKPFVPVTADTLVQTGPGFLECIIYSETDAAPTAGTISILDSTTAGGGTVILTWSVGTSVFTPVQVCPLVPFTTGLYIDFTTTADVQVKTVYR